MLILCTVTSASHHDQSTATTSGTTVSDCLPPTAPIQDDDDVSDPRKMTTYTNNKSMNQLFFPIHPLSGPLSSQVPTTVHHTPAREQSSANGGQPTPTNHRCMYQILCFSSLCICRHGHHGPSVSISYGCLRNVLAPVHANWWAIINAITGDAGERVKPEAHLQS